ncbi:LysR family transcriptional regulator [Vibrio sp. 10N.286.49.B3]|uniref:LysR family transcriptional regulator n=1 Tax=Vibrio sp. 10N.286.49.B3 TaxID=1880855 RepID=UPI001F52D4EF|nr:LysR family transcriptional regulator [Vibrio sp. 10N.286.49.B3]
MRDLFYRLDLNLLRTFLVLSQEKNMRKASKRLSVSQPALSQALQKLRHHFEDELFVKVPTGLEPTLFAMDLQAAITPHLDGLSSALNSSKVFDPIQIESTITIALSPVVLTCLSGSLYRRLRELAPRAKIELINWNKSTCDDIKNNDVLLGINYDLSNQKEVYTKHIINLEGRVIVRKDHPIHRELAKPSDFEGYDIASFINPGWNDRFSYAANIMQSHGYKVNVAFRSEMVMALIDVILHTDMIMPHSNLFPLELYPNLRAIDVEINKEEKELPLFSHFHVKNRNNALVAWLHSEITTLLHNQVKLSW